MRTEQLVTVPPNSGDLSCLLEANKEWAESVKQTSPEVFSETVKGQNPKVLWIGCADSRIPVARVTGVGPGELFVHRNVANLCLPNDLNLLSTLAYAVDHLKVEHIVVAGHYECGGVAAALSSQSYGLIDHWIKAIKDVYHRNKKRIQTLQSVKERARLLVELNVANSVFELSRSGIVQGAWKRDQPLKLHGWVYRLEDGILEDLGININKIDDVPLEYRV